MFRELSEMLWIIGRIAHRREGTESSSSLGIEMSGSIHWLLSVDFRKVWTTAQQKRTYTNINTLHDPVRSWIYKMKSFYVYVHLHTYGTEDSLQTRND